MLLKTFVQKYGEYSKKEKNIRFPEIIFNKVSIINKKHILSVALSSKGKTTMSSGTMFYMDHNESPLIFEISMYLRPSLNVLIKDIDVVLVDYLQTMNKLEIKAMDWLGNKIIIKDSLSNIKNLLDSLRKFTKQ